MAVTPIRDGAAVHCCSTTAEEGARRGGMPLSCVAEAAGAGVTQRHPV